jgi:hypothetical protein
MNRNFIARRSTAAIISTLERSAQEEKHRLPLLCATRYGRHDRKNKKKTTFVIITYSNITHSHLTYVARYLNDCCFLFLFLRFMQPQTSGFFQHRLKFHYSQIAHKVNIRLANAYSCQIPLHVLQY